MSITAATMASATKAMAPMRPRVLPSNTPPSIVAIEHLRVAGLVAGSRRQEATALLLSLRGGGSLFGRLQRLRAAIGGHDGGEIAELLRLKGEKLVTGLRRLQRAGRRLARADQRRHLGGVGGKIADYGGLRAHGVLQAADRVLPAPC